MMATKRTNPYTGRRVTATIIDYTFIFGFTFWYIFTFGNQDTEGTYTVSGLPALVPMVVWFLYLVVPEKLFSSTLGHRLCGLKIISLSGNELGFGQVIKRRIADALEITWCFGLIAFILVKNTEFQQRLGDLWAKTQVVDRNEPAYIPDFEFEQPTATI
jgi:uncharacterized RDD family membrane protein YckC